MNDKIVDFMSEVALDNYDAFIDQAIVDSTCFIKPDAYDYSWLGQVEQYLPFVSSIVNFNYTEADYMVETSYENRFIKTLLYRLNDFIILEVNKFQNDDMSSSLNTYTSKVKTSFDDTLVDVDIKVSINNQNMKKGSSYGMTLKERIDRVSAIVTSLLKTPFMEKLKDSSFVRNPISKTPILEEELNYRKALELYNFIENFKTTSKNLTDSETDDLLKSRSLTLSYFAYQTLEMLKNDSHSENVYQLFLNRLIEKAVVSSTIDDKAFKRMLAKKFEDEYSKKKNREQNIQNIFLKSIDGYNKQVKDALRALKS